MGQRPVLPLQRRHHLCVPRLLGHAPHHRHQLVLGSPRRLRPLRRCDALCHLHVHDAASAWEVALRHGRRRVLCSAEQQKAKPRRCPPKGLHGAYTLKDRHNLAV